VIALKLEVDGKITLNLIDPVKKIADFRSLENYSAIFLLEPGNEHYYPLRKQTPTRTMTEGRTSWYISQNPKDSGFRILDVGELKIRGVQNLAFINGIPKCKVMTNDQLKGETPVSRRGWMSQAVYCENSAVSIQAGDDAMTRAKKILTSYYHVIHGMLERQYYANCPAKSFGRNLFTVGYRVIKFSLIEVPYDQGINGKIAWLQLNFGGIDPDQLIPGIGAYGKFSTEQTVDDAATLADALKRVETLPRKKWRRKKSSSLILSHLGKRDEEMEIFEKTISKLKFREKGMAKRVFEFARLNNYKYHAMIFGRIPSPGNLCEIWMMYLTEAEKKKATVNFMFKFHPQWKKFEFEILADLGDERKEKERSEKGKVMDLTMARCIKEYELEGKTAWSKVLSDADLIQFVEIMHFPKFSEDVLKKIQGTLYEEYEKVQGNKFKEFYFDLDGNKLDKITKLPLIF